MTQYLNKINPFSDRMGKYKCNDVANEYIYILEIDRVICVNFDLEYAQLNGCRINFLFSFKWTK